MTKHGRELARVRAVSALQCVVVLPFFLFGDPSAAVLSQSFPSKLSHGVGEGTVLYRVDLLKRVLLLSLVEPLHGSKIARIIFFTL